MTKDNSSLLGLKETARLFKVHPNTLRTWDKTGLLRAIRIGSGVHRRYRYEDIQKLIEKNRYVQSPEEVKRVGKVRSGYFQEFSDLLIKYGELGAEDIIVDAPCGNGGMTQALISKNIGRKYYLVDINQDMLESARELVPEKSEFILADVVNLDSVISEQVDAILCLNGFDIYIDQKEKFLKNAKKILKKDGLLIFDVSTRGLDDEVSLSFLNYLKEEMEELAIKANIKAKINPWPDRKTLSRYRDMVSKSGLTLEKTFLDERWQKISDFVDNTIQIQGRLRPMLPNMIDEERIELYKRATDTARKKSGIKLLNQTRMFFIIRNK